MKRFLACTICIICISNIFASDKYSVRVYIQEINCIKSEKLVNEITLLSIGVCNSGANIKVSSLNLLKGRRNLVSIPVFKSKNGRNVFNVGFAIAPFETKLKFNRTRAIQEILNNRKNNKNTFHLGPDLRKIIGTRRSRNIGVYTKNISLAAKNYLNHLSTIRIKTKNATFEIKYRSQFVKLDEMYELAIKLVKVKCFDTENSRTTDHFYIIGGSKVASQKNAFCTFSVEMSRRKPDKILNQIIFKNNVSKNAVVVFALMGLDENGVQRNERKTISKKISKILDKIPFSQKKLYPSQMRRFVNSFSSEIKRITSSDDQLGTYSFNKKVKNIKFPNSTFGEINTGKKLITWVLKGKKGRSSWNYEVQIQIEKKLIGETD